MRAARLLLVRPGIIRTNVRICLWLVDRWMWMDGIRARDTCGLSLFIYFDSIKQSAVFVMHRYIYNAISSYHIIIYMNGVCVCVCRYHENETIPFRSPPYSVHRIYLTWPNIQCIIE